MYLKQKYGMKAEVNDWCDYKCIFWKSYVLQWINMVRVIEYHFVFSHELSKWAIWNNVEVWISNKGTQTLYNFIFILHFSNPNKKDYTTIDAKCMVILQFSQQTLVSITRIPRTLYQPLIRPHSCKAPYQTLISSSCPHRLLLVFWELILGYVTPLDWYPYFLMAR